MRTFHLPGFSKPSIPDNTTGTPDFAAARMRLSLVAWFALGLFFILVIAPRLLGMS